MKRVQTPFDGSFRRHFLTMQLLLLLSGWLICRWVVNAGPYVVEVDLEQQPHVVEAVALYSQAQQEHDTAQAIHLYEQSINTYPLLAGAYNNLGMLLMDEGQTQQAWNMMERGIEVAKLTNDTENLASIHNNMGFLIRSLHRDDIGTCLRAIQQYDLGLELDPTRVGLLYNKASALNAMRKHKEAEAILRQVIEIEPTHESANMDLGSIHFHRGELLQAIHHQDVVIESATDEYSVLGALSNKGQFLKELHLHDQALQVHLQAIQIAPENALALANVITTKRTLCQWQDIEKYHDVLIEKLDEELQSDNPSSLPNHGLSLLPYDSTLLRVSDQYRKRLAAMASKRYQQSQLVALTFKTFHKRRQTDPNARLRIGYLTFDFREHPMGQLTIGPLENHDLTRIELFCFSYGENDASEWRQRAEAACPSFSDLYSVSDIDAAQDIASHQVDLLVDLMAHTKGSRIGIPSLKPSPLIVNYLGYPGTTGATFAEFVLADRFVVPPEQAKSTMSEQVVYLPHTYQANLYRPDFAFCGGSRHGTLENRHNCQQRDRELHQLPHDAVVFCNFNTINKMEVIAFGVWMRILHRVPNSVLWLLSPGSTPAGESIRHSLLAEAEALGISAQRIVFASRLPKQKHLMRLRHADLFLDSFIYNAHSTASDALWTNLPLLTLCGDTFPSRVAAGLLRNALPDDLADTLIAFSIKEYEELAVELAQKPGFLARLRHALSQNSLISPLFDTPRMTRNLEAAYEAMYEVDQLKDVRPFHLLVQADQMNDFAPLENSARRVDGAIQWALERLLQQNFLDEAGWMYRRILEVDEQNAEAFHLLGLVYFYQQDLDQAVELLSKAVTLAPEIALYVGNRGSVYDAMQNWTMAQADYMRVLELGAAGDQSAALPRVLDILYQQQNMTGIISVLERFGHTFVDSNSIVDDVKENILLLWSFVLAQLNEVIKAIDVLEEMWKQHPTFFRVAHNLGALYASRSQFDRTDQFQTQLVLKESRFLFESKGRAVNKVPRPKDRMVVAVYCYEYGQTWWNEWGPSSLNQGLGGSEEAVVFLAQQLALRGYFVEVYGNPPLQDIEQNGLRDFDVVWYPHYAFDAETSVDVFIAWRYYISLALSSNARAKYFWIHDMPPPGLTRSALVLDQVDGILCVSSFQASKIVEQARTAIPQERLEETQEESQKRREDVARKLQSKLIVTSNALEPTIHFADGPNDPTRFVYGSSPSRGLYYVLRAWQKIRQQIPNASLRVFYGFTQAFVSWAKDHMNDYTSWRAEMDALLQQPGVEYIGLVSHTRLADEYAQAGFYLYPTMFEETSCVSLMKAMANGAVPITSRFPRSALSETCDQYDLGPRALDPSGIANDPQWMNLWIQSIVDAVKNNHGTTAEVRRNMKSFARQKYQWANVAVQWGHEFRQRFDPLQQTADSIDSSKT